MLAHRGDGGEHGRAGRKTVVHEDHGAAAQVGRWAVGAVEALTPLEFGQLGGGDGFDGVFPQTEVVDDLAVQHANAAAGNGAHREFFVAGDAEFADDKHVQREAQFAGHLMGDRHAATGQSQDEGPRDVRAVAQSRSQNLPCRAPLRVSRNHDGVTAGIARWWGCDPDAPGTSRRPDARLLPARLAPRRDGRRRERFAVPSRRRAARRLPRSGR